MASHIYIDIDNQPVITMLRELAHRVENPRPALLLIGEKLAENTKQRFVNQKGPDGVDWAPNSQVTIDRKGGRGSILTDYGTLGDSIAASVESDNTIIVSTSIEYAAMQQFGGKKSDFPNLWGDIPARPFMGFSDHDQDEVLEILRDFLID